MKLVPVMIAVVGLFLASLRPYAADNFTLRKTITIASDSLKIENVSNGRQRIRLSDLQAIQFSDLPVFEVGFQIPDGYSVRDVSVDPISWFTPEGEVLPLELDSEVDGAGAGKKSGLPLSLGRQWNAGLESLFHQGRIRGHDIAGIVVRPVQYQAESKRLRLCTKFDVVLNLQAALPAQNRLQIKRESVAGEQMTRSAFGRLNLRLPDASQVSDRSHLTSKVNSGAPFNPTFRPTVDGSPVEMVIITDQAESTSYQQLANFKTKIGVPTVVRTVSWILANYPHGVDEPETIRLFLRDAAEKWGTTYVLLGGDTEIIPTRQTVVGPTNYDPVPSDYYYSDLDGTWDADGDNLFGEIYYTPTYPGDDVDFYPDLYVGRLPSKTQTEAATLVNKILAYEQNPPTSFIKKSLLLGEVVLPQNYTSGATIDFDGAAICEDLPTLSFPIAWLSQMTRLYENYTAYSGSQQETKQSAINAINAGYGLIHHVGHGFVNTMSVGSSTLGNSDASAFTNSTRQGILYAGTCSAGKIDANCISEAFLLNSAGGAVAVIAASHLNGIYQGWDYQREWYGGLFSLGLGHIGVITAEAKIALAPIAAFYGIYSQTVLGEHCLGDPEMWIWNPSGSEPLHLTLSHPSTFTLGSSPIHVVVTASGSPVNGARVCISKGSDAYVVGLTASNGAVDLSFPADLPGTFYVGAWAPNYVAVVDSGTVIAPASSAYLFPVSQTIDDDLSGSSIGNGDALINPGETIEFRPVLKNGGAITATSPIAVLTTSDPNISIGVGTCNYPNIAAGNQSSPSNSMRFSVSRNTPDRYVAHATLTIQGTSFAKGILLYVQAPVLEYWSQTIRDTVGNGNGNGAIAAGEDFVIIPKLRNLGAGRGRLVEVRLRSNDSAVTVLDSVSVIGAMDPDEIKANHVDGVRCRLSNVTPPHELRMVLKDAYGELGYKKVDWLLPLTPSSLDGKGQASSIELSWAPVSSGDLKGYNVYRSPSLTPATWVKVNDLISERIGYYRDDGLPAFTRYFYVISAVDSSGNEGVWSLPISTTTTLPLRAGFPVGSAAQSPTAGVTFADLDGDGQLELLTGGEEVYVLRADGREYIDGDHDVRNRGPFSNTNGSGFWNTPSVGDVDHDGDPEVAAASWSPPRLYLWDNQGNVMPGFPKDLNPSNHPEPNPVGSVVLGDVDDNHDLEIFVECADKLFGWQHDGTELLDGDNNPATNGIFRILGAAYNYGTPSIADFDGNPDRKKEIIVPSRDHKLYVMRANGTDLPGFPFQTAGSITSSPAVGDIDNDSRPEIVFVSSGQTEMKPVSDRSAPIDRESYPAGGYAPKIALHLHPYPLSKGQTFCAAGNINSCADVVIHGNVAQPYYVYVLGANYNPSYGLGGMSFGLNYDSTPGQGIYLSGWTSCAALQFATQSPLPTWPASGSGNRLTWDANSSDANSGCQHDSVAVAGVFYVYSYSNTTLNLTTNPSNSQAVIANCAGNRQILEPQDLGRIGFGTAVGVNPCPEGSPTTGTVHAIRVDLTEPSGWPVSIPMNGDMDSSPALADLNQDLYPDVIVGSSNGNLYCLSGNNAQTLAGFPFYSGAPIYSSPIVGDLNNDGDQDILFGNDAGSLYGLSHSGEILDGFPIKTSNKISSAPFIWDIDNNGTTEIGVRGSDQMLYCWNTPWSFSPTSMTWPKFKKNASNDGNRLGSSLPYQTGVPNNLNSSLPSLKFVNPARRGAIFQILAPSGGRLEVLDIAGRIVYSEHVEENANLQRIKWEPRARNGVALPSGIYFVRMFGKGQIVKKLVLMN